MCGKPGCTGLRLFLRPHLIIHRDPNVGHSSVPARWEPYTLQNREYLEINNKINSNSMKRDLKSNFLQFWIQTYQALPTVSDDATLPPTDDSETAPVPPTDDSEAAPEPPTDDSEAAPLPPSETPEETQVPLAIGF